MLLSFVFSACGEEIEDELAKKEFDYFYNLELVQELETLATENATDFNDDDEVMKKLIDFDYDDTPELDDILDKLLEEGNLLNEVLNELKIDTADRRTTKKRRNKGIIQ